MPDETDDTSRQHFARDLCRIRKDRGVSLEEIRGATQISSAQLEAFESGRLFDQSSMNRVYLRAFVRAYADAIGLPTEPVLTTFDAAFHGDYSGDLADEYLERPSSEEDGDGDSSREFSAPQSEEEQDAELDPGDGTADSGLEADEGSSSSDVVGGSELRQQEDDFVGVGEPASSPSWMKGDKEDGEEEVDYPLDAPASATDASTSSHSSTSGGSPSPPRHRGFWTEVQRWMSRHRERVLFITGLLIFAGLIGGGGILYVGDSSSARTGRANSEEAEPSQATKTPASPDTADGSASVRSPATIRLEDTLHVTVLAINDIREMRIRRDNDLRRPYWIEAQQATVFPFTQRIIIERQLENARFFLEGYPFPRSRTDTQGRIVIDRQVAQAFADTLRGSSPPISAPIDTAAILHSPSDTTAE